MTEVEEVVEVRPVEEVEPVVEVEAEVQPLVVAVALPLTDLLPAQTLAA